MKANPICRTCGVILDSENWYPSHKKQNNRTCKECQSKISKQWREENPERAKALQIKHNHRLSQQRAEYRKNHPLKLKHKRRNSRPFNENKECSMYLGCHVAERVLSHVFKDVVVMPPTNPGYDFICNKGKKVDAKSSCQRKNGRWDFDIKHNTTPDYFLCLAFDNREDLNPLHAWLIPGSKLNHKSGTGIRPGTIHKWDKYRLDITKISDCCDAMR